MQLQKQTLPDTRRPFSTCFARNPYRKAVSHWEPLARFVTCYLVDYSKRWGDGGDLSSTHVPIIREGGGGWTLSDEVYTYYTLLSIQQIEDVRPVYITYHKWEKGFFPVQAGFRVKPPLYNMLSTL
jgi:hypothetical protein